MASDVKVESSNAYLLKLGKNLSRDFDAIYIVSKNVVSIYADTSKVFLYLQENK